MISNKVTTGHRATPLLVNDLNLLLYGLQKILRMP
jgi:hypothetical protein